MSKDREGEGSRFTSDGEHREWQEELRVRFAPWFDELVGSFQCRDGWAHLIIDLTESVGQVIGGPGRAPELRVVEVKQKLGGLRYRLANLPKEMPKLSERRCEMLLKGAFARVRRADVREG